MTDILNLDEISTTEDKSVTLKGVTHKFKPLSVGDFIDQLKRIEDTTQATGSENIVSSLEMITASFPTLTVDILRTLNTAQLDALGKFIRGEMLEEAVTGAAAATGETADATKKE